MYRNQSARLRAEHLEDREVPATFAVTTALDVVNPADGKLSLRAAVGRANAHPGVDTVVLPAGVFKITLDESGIGQNSGGDFDVTDSVVIQGAGAGLTVIDGQRKDRLFDLLGPIGVRFSGVTLRHGDSPADGGGAVHAADANVRLVNCVVSDNRGLFGGGIANEQGHVRLVGTAVVRNAAQAEGGGVGAATLTATGSTVGRNIAGAGGGGVLALTANLTDCTVSGNT